MALGGGDVMRLPRLLLGTRQRILLEVRAVELPRLGGAAGEEGGGEGRPRITELLMPPPSLLSRCASQRRGPGDHPTLGHARQNSLGPQGKAGTPIPSWRKQTFSLPSRHTGNRRTGVRGQPGAHTRTHTHTHTHTRTHTHVHSRAWAGSRDSGSLLRDALPAPPEALLPYLPDDWRSVSKLLPETAPSTPLGSLREGKEVGRAVGNTQIPELRPQTPLLLLCKT